MSEVHITDEEIHQASGNAPRTPPGIPKATCLRCLAEHPAFYASMAHDCRVELGQADTYANWLLKFQRWGYGVLQSPNARKFPRWDMEVTGRKMLTFHLQADIEIGPGYEFKDWYNSDEFQNAGFPVLAEAS